MWAMAVMSAVSHPNMIHNIMTPATLLAHVTVSTSSAMLCQDREDGEGGLLTCCTVFNTADGEWFLPCYGAMRVIVFGLRATLAHDCHFLYKFPLPRSAEVNWFFGSTYYLWLCYVMLCYVIDVMLCYVCCVML